MFCYPGFVFRNLGISCQCQTDFVQPFHQALAAEGVEVERKTILIGGRNGHRFEIDGNRLVLRDHEQPVDRILRQHDGDDPVLEGVSGKNVGEAWRDHGGDAHIGKRPGGMFATGATAEIVARDQDLGSGIARIVEDIACLRTHRFKRALAKALSRNGLQPMRGDNDVGIDILLPPRIGRAGHARYRLHHCAPAGR
ncbi:hypothetical protein D9M73_135650 [compost metagenome]